MKERAKLYGDNIRLPDAEVCYSVGFIEGLRYALECEEVKEMREVLADIIRNSHDIVAKKLASRALANFDELIKETVK